MITLIATVLNEGATIHHLLDGLLQQTIQPDEIIIVDGGSSDDTVSVLRTYAAKLPLKIIVQPDCNISQGRNIAIEAAQGDILAITDAGVRLSATWLEKITQPLLDNPAISVVCGFFKADPQTIFEIAMGATVLPLASEIDAQTFLPSSRSIALRKSAAEGVSGYPEWLDYCEDLVFDLCLKATQPAFAFVPEALVYFRPRATMKAYFKQYYLYARGDGKADLWRKRHAIRYVTYFGAVPLLLLLAIAIHPAFLILALVGGYVYLLQPFRRVAHLLSTTPQPSSGLWLQVMLLVPLIRAVGDIAKMLGYPAGWYWRWQQQPPDWQQNRRTN